MASSPSQQDVPSHNSTKSAPADQPISSTASSASLLGVRDDLDTNVQPQLKAEPMSPFSGTSLTLDFSHSQLSSDSPLSSTPRSLTQSYSLPMSLPLAQSHTQAPSQIQSNSPSLTLTPTFSSATSTSSLPASTSSTATAAVTTVKSSMHTSQLPPMPPTLTMPHSQHQYQQQQLQSSRSLLQSQLQAQSHVNLGAVSSANISQQHAFGLAHLSELMTGGLMVSKQPPTPGAHPNGHSNRSQLPGVSSHDMFQHHAPSTFMALQQQQQQPQPSSSHSNQDPFSYDQTTASLYCTPQDQHEQQQRHAAFLMSRGPSSSSTCSTSSSTTLHDVLSGGSGGSTGGSSSNGSVNGCGNSNSSNSNQHGHNQTAFNAMTVMGGAKPMISTSVAAMMGPMNPVQTSGVAAIEKMDGFYDRLLSMSFEQSSDAITKCRDLAREHGFTVKQETSSNKNVYLYCSREGVPDSVKNNKEIKRKRLSMRCDCKWRITLFQQESKLWVFRKAMNPASMNHNHALISPDDIRQPWPAMVFDRIAYYANQRNLSTSETRERIKDDFPDLVWDERRFYNRLTEERKQIKLRDSESRVFSTMDLAARVASLASADATLFYKVTSSLENVLVEICEQLRIDPAGANSRVLTSPPPSAGGGAGGHGGAGSSSMSVTSPTSNSPGFCPSSSSSSSPLSPSDYVVTYPGCVISVKSTPNQKGRPSSISSPVVDSSYGLGLGMSPLNERKRSLSDECFTRHGISGIPTATPSFGSAMSATQMMSHLDMSAAAAVSGGVAPLQGSISGLDPSVMPGSSGLLMMQGGGGYNHSHQQQQQQQHHHQQQQQQLQYHPHDTQPHHGNHHLPSGMATAFRQQPPQHHQHVSHAHYQQHQQQQHPQHIHPATLSQEDLSSSELSLDFDGSDSSRQEQAPIIKRTNSVDIKQEIQTFYQPMLSAQPQQQQQHQQQQQQQQQRRVGGSPGASNGSANRLYSPSGFHSGQLLGGDSEDVFSNTVAFQQATAAAAGSYHYNASSAAAAAAVVSGTTAGNYLHTGYSSAGQPSSSNSNNSSNGINNNSDNNNGAGMIKQSSPLGQHDR